MSEKLEKVDKLKAVAERLDASVAQLAIAWTAHNPNVSTVITGATNEQQVCTFSLYLVFAAAQTKIRPHHSLGWLWLVFFLKGLAYNPQDVRASCTRAIALAAQSVSCTAGDLVVIVCVQLADNLGALDVLPKLTPEVLEEIEGIVQSKPELPPSSR